VSERHRGCTLACLALLLGLAQAALAQTLEQAVKACAAETDVLLRLACYDRAAAQLAGAQAPAAGPVSSAAPGAAPRTESGAAEFGLRNGPLDQRKYSAAPKEITATVTLVELRRSNGAARPESPWR